MAVQIPDFTSLGVATPRPNGALPNFPSSDPGAANEAAFGSALQKAGGALVDVAAYQDIARNRLNESNATLDLVNRLVPLHTQISTETDPNKIAELRQQYDSILQTSGTAIDDPARRQAWMARHANTILQAHADADKRVTLLDREQVAADAMTRIDTVTRNGALSDDPNAISGTLSAINDNLDWLQKYGAISPGQRYTAGKAATRQLLTGRASYLIDKGRPDEALSLLDQHPTDLDPGVAESFRRRALQAKEKLTRKSDADALWGGSDKGYAGNRGMRVGGAIPGRIAQVAEASNVDPTTALATASIESDMGRNLGSRGNIFQLGRTEWAGVGGGRMGDADTDIRNGVAFLGQKKQELASALGRDPQPWEIYLAHQQGTAGALALLDNPSKPAGEVVPPQNIAANGGDPKAPASAFVDRWRTRFQRVASAVGNAVLPSANAATPTDNFDLAAGDSIAVQQIRHGISGSEAPFKSEGLGPSGTSARIGDSPEQVLARINTLDKVPATVFLSSGTSNNPQQAGFVGDQIDALKAKGATAIVVPGVGPGVKNAAAVNASLKSVVEEHGGIFFQPDIKWQKDGIHPAEVDKMRQQGLAALKASGGSGTAAPAAAGGDEGAPAAGGNLAPLPDIAAKIQAAQDRADSGEWTQEHANAVQADLHSRYNRLQAAQAQDRAQLKRQLTDGMAALEDGKDWAPNEPLIRHLLPKEAADEVLDKIDDAKQIGVAKQAVWNASADDLNQQWTDIQGRLDPAQPGYAKRRRYADAFLATVKKREEALKDDPAAFAFGTPTVGAAYQAIDPQNPGPGTQAAIRASLAEQERLGVRTENQRVLTKSQAQDLVYKIANTDPAQADIGAMLSQQAQVFGEYWPRAFGDLVKGGLPPIAQTIAAMDTPEQTAGRADFQRMLRVASEKGGLGRLKEAAPKIQAKAIDDGLDETMDNFRATTRDVNLYDAVRDSVKNLAYYYAYQGQNGTAALASAYDAVIGKKYDFDGALRVPKGKLGEIERAGANVVASIKPEDLADPGGNPNLSPAQRRTILFDAVNNGHWVTNESDTGAVLMLRLRDNTMIPARRKDGSRVEFSFTNAPTLAASAPAPIPAPFPMTLAPAAPISGADLMRQDVR